MDGAISRDQTSAASPAASARPPDAGGRRCRPVGQRLPGEPGEVEREPLRQARAEAAEPGPDLVGAALREEELRRRQERELADGLHGPLVGRVEGTEAVDLVAEELDPDRQRRRRREHVDDAAPARELAAAGDLEDGGVAALEELREERVQPTREPVRSVRGSAGRSDGASVAWSSAWTDATSTRAWPGRHDASAATRAAVSSGTSSERSYASDVRGSSTDTSPGSPSHAPSSSATRSPISASRATQQIRSPPVGERQRGREERLRAVRHRREAHVAPVHGRRRGRAEPLPERPERPRPVEQPRQDREVGHAPARPARRGPVARSRRRGRAPGATGPRRPAGRARVGPCRRVEQLDLGLGRRAVEVRDGLLRLGGRASLRPVAGDLLGDVALAGRPPAIPVARWSPGPAQEERLEVGGDRPDALGVLQVRSGQGSGPGEAREEDAGAWQDAPRREHRVAMPASTRTGAASAASRSGAAGTTTRVSSSVPPKASDVARTISSSGSAPAVSTRSVAREAASPVRRRYRR